MFCTKLFGSNATIPPPYLRSLDQHRRIAERPSRDLLSDLESRLRSCGQPLLCSFDEDSLRSLLGHVVPAFFDLVAEHGYLPERISLTPVHQLPLQAEMGYLLAQIGETDTDDDHGFSFQDKELFTFPDNQ